MTLFSQAGSHDHASHTAQQESEKAKTMTATSGRKCLEQFGKFNRAGSWAKTFAGLLIGMEGWYSTRCKLIWKLKATKCSRFYFQLQVSELRTGEIGYGLLPTPIVVDSAGTTALEKIDARRKRMKERNNGKNGMNYSGNGFGQTLGEMMQRGLLPTPAARDYRSGFAIESDVMKNRMTNARGVNLHEHIQRQIGNNFQLNPLFVGEMMGFPIDWLTGPFLQNQEQEYLPESKHMGDGEKKA